jgi:hypothetical protein
LYKKLPTFISLGIQLKYFSVSFTSKHIKLGQAWWQMPVNPALSRRRPKDCDFEANLGYTRRQ